MRPTSRACARARGYLHFNGTQWDTGTPIARYLLWKGLRMKPSETLPAWMYRDPAEVAERAELQAMAHERAEARRKAQQALALERAFKTPTERKP
jgi:hypothetical protein